MKKTFLTFLKGMAMGAADIVPGVSGGTVAFITGVYEDLLAGIKNLGGPAWYTLKKRGFKAFWQQSRMPILLPLIIGIGFSIATLSRIIQFALNEYGLFTWSFFFGLIIASAFLVFKKIENPTPAVWLFFSAGLILALEITRSAPVSIPEGTIYIFISGFVAISAMILPGISGSFILLLLGKYDIILQAVTSLELGVLVVFAMGCVVGLITMANILSWLLQRFHDQAVGLLSGFMVGALYKVWPWKKVIETRINSKGIEVPFIEKSIWPGQMESDPMVMGCVLFFVAGIILVVSIEWIARKSKPNRLED
ncbi:DUF368 domain-containing protein [Schleiferia thermophila]|jgi:putative membrane protein|nr:DUF368 domain-containing protein [Schleiferia thermophila]KFD38822.1 membrane protein [Schleiferia thermophila str. Yellowstone]PMB38036.1 DUF368 domain-containing protein [Fischerella thermalis CCMEE 5319]